MSNLKAMQEVARQSVKGGAPWAYIYERNDGDWRIIYDSRRMVLNSPLFTRFYYMVTLLGNEPVIRQLKLDTLRKQHKSELAKLWAKRLLNKDYQWS